MPWSLLLGGAKTLLGGISSKTWLIVAGSIAALFLVVRPLKRWIVDLFSDNRTTAERADDAAEKIAAQNRLDAEEVAQGAKDLAWWLGELPNMNYFERNDINHGDIYEYLKGIDKPLFDAIKEVYDDITRSKSELLDDLRKYFNKGLYRKLQKQGHLGL